MATPNRRRRGTGRRPTDSRLFSLSVLLKGKMHAFLNERFQSLLEGFSLGKRREISLVHCLPEPALGEGMGGETPEEMGRRLATHFMKREKPLFVFAPRDIDEIVSMIPEDRKRGTLESARRTCLGRFSFRGSPEVHFPGKVDWNYRPDGSIDWTCDLNRHFFLVDLGRAYGYQKDPRYLETLHTLINDWLIENPPSVKSLTWRKILEVSVRLNTWIWVFFTCLPHPFYQENTLERTLRGIEMFASFLYRHLEYGNLGNHILIEAKNLFMGGLLFPEFKESGRWRRRGEKIFFRELERQILSDGCHAELSPMYHRIIASELIELHAVLLKNNHPGLVVLEDKIEEMNRFELNLRRPDGRLPLFGDSTLSDDLIRFPGSGEGRLLSQSERGSWTCSFGEADCWLCGPKLPDVREIDTEPSGGSLRFRDSGYIVMRNGKVGIESYMALDCGPFGYRLGRGHGHSDFLSFEIFAFGRPLMIDPGYNAYNIPEEWRTYFRSTRAHNTVMIDRKEQVPFLRRITSFLSPAPTLEFFNTGGWIDLLSGSHFGYKRLSDPVVHRRRVVYLKGEYWFIIDTLDGRERHETETFFHASPKTSLRSLDGNGWLLSEPGSSGKLILVPSIEGDYRCSHVEGELNPIQGWASLYSGHVEPAPVVIYRRKSRMPSISAFLLFLDPGDTTPSGYPSVVPLRDYRSMLDVQYLGWEIMMGKGRRDAIVLSQRPSLRPTRLGRIRTNAEWLYIENHPMGGIRRIAVKGGTLVDVDDRPILRSQVALPLLEMTWDGTEIDILMGNDCEFWVATSSVDRVTLNGKRSRIDFRSVDGMLHVRREEKG